MEIFKDGRTNGRTNRLTNKDDYCGSRPVNSGSKLSISPVSLHSGFYSIWANYFSKELQTIFTLVTYLEHVLLYLSIYSAQLYWHTFWQCIPFFNKVTWSSVNQALPLFFWYFWITFLAFDIFSVRFYISLWEYFKVTALIERHFAHLQMEINTL